jgi:hypothetical protein
MLDQFPRGTKRKNLKKRLLQLDTASDEQNAQVFNG